MNMKPELKNMDDFGVRMTAVNGTTVPFKGYTEADIKVKNAQESFRTLILIVPDTDYHERVPVLLGTNIIRQKQ